MRTKDEWARVEIDNKQVGDTPINRTRVTPGRHTVVLLFDDGSRVCGAIMAPVPEHVRLTGSPYRDDSSR